VAVASRALRGRVLAAVHSDRPRRSQSPPARALVLSGRSVPAPALLTVGAGVALAVLAILLTAPGRSSQYAGTVFGAGRGASAILRRSDGQAELRVSGLPATTPARAYQVWLLARTGPPRPTDVLFTVSRGGTATVAVPGSLRGVREVIVTSEPRGGSARPSTPPAVSVLLPAAGA